MKVAVTYENGRVFQHFGKTQMFLTADVVDGDVRNVQLLSSDGSGHGALAQLLKQWGVETLICGGIGQGAVNALNEQGKAIKGSRILILGLAYKKNIDDTRESPAVEIMDLLQEKGADIAYSDPHVPAFPRKRYYHFDLQSVELNADSIASYDCIVIATDHDGFDYELLQQQARLIVDTRGRLPQGANNVVPA